MVHRQNVEKNEATGPAEELCAVLANLHASDEIHAFLIDLTTPAELRALAERWKIAQLLHSGGHSYREIAAIAGASTTTVARVARFLQHEPHGGYRLALDKAAISKVVG